jgi:hypothetical protein
MIAELLVEKESRQQQRRCQAREGGGQQAHAQRAGQDLAG